jgi:sarcosine oxidase/L-pipecolate oxidase
VANVVQPSTAWHLARTGHTNVKIIDRHQVPSPDSAGYDLNKVFRTQYSDELYSKLAIEARNIWKSEPVLEGCYHESGYIFAVLGKSKKRYATPSIARLKLHN